MEKFVGKDCYQFCSDATEKVVMIFGKVCGERFSVFLESCGYFLTMKEPKVCGERFSVFLESCGYFLMMIFGKVLAQEISVLLESCGYFFKIKYYLRIHNIYILL